MTDDQHDRDDDSSAYYAADHTLGTDGDEGSDASEGGDDTADLDEVRNAPDQMFGTIGGGDR